MQGKVLLERSATPVYVGIDVCKARLDVYIRPTGQKLTVSNDRDGLKRLKRVLKTCKVALVVMEATGKLHRLAHRNLHAGGFAVAVVNPLRSHLFAEALGTLAKTDAVDARMLAILGESLKPTASEPQAEHLETLRELVGGRDAAVAARTALKNQLGVTPPTKHSHWPCGRQATAASILIGPALAQALIGLGALRGSPCEGARSSPRVSVLWLS